MGAAYQIRSSAWESHLCLGLTEVIERKKACVRTGLARAKGSTISASLILLSRSMGLSLLQFTLPCFPHFIIQERKKGKYWVLRRVRAGLCPEVIVSTGLPIQLYSASGAGHCWQWRWISESHSLRNGTKVTHPVALEWTPKPRTCDPSGWEQSHLSDVPRLWGKANSTRERGLGTDVAVQANGCSLGSFELLAWADWGGKQENRPGLHPSL